MVQYDKIEKIGDIYGTVYMFETTVDVPSVGATSVLSLDITASGVKTGDMIIGYKLEDMHFLGHTIIGGVFASNDKITVLYSNPSTLASTSASVKHTFIIFRPQTNI